MRPIDTSRKRLIIMSLSILAGMVFATCQPDQVKADDQPAASPLVQQVQVGQVTGGSGSSMAWRAHVNSSMFGGMFRDSLRERGLWSAIGGRFVVSAEMIEFSTPDLNGFNFDGFVSASVRYRVITVNDNAVVFEKLVRNTVRVESQPLPGGRIRRRLPSDEKVVRRNISQFIDALIEQAQTDPAFRPAN
jgi:hypothetical protein